jgi:hypothetical protein
MLREKLNFIKNLHLINLSNKKHKQIKEVGRGEYWKMERKQRGEGETNRGEIFASIFFIVHFTDDVVFGVWFIINNKQCYN